MRRTVFVCRALFAASLMVWICLALPVSADTNKPVKVDVKCPRHDDGKFAITVDPFEVVVTPGEGVEWKLYTNASRSEEIAVSAKDPEDWLYADSTVEGNKTVVMTEMVDTTPGKTYEYQITVYCGEREPVVLDPRIKVDGG